MPNDEGTPAPVAGAGVQKSNLASHNDTALLDVREVEEALLRGMLFYPADRLRGIADSLESKDFPDASHRRILQVIHQAVHALEDAGEGGRTVCPSLIKEALLNAGDLEHQVTAHVLLEVVTGNPPAWHDFKKLADTLRVQRLRRLARDVGAELIAVSDHSVADLTAVLRRVDQLEHAARRAGLEVAA